MKKWTRDEDRKMRQSYAKRGPKGMLALFPDRTERSIQQRALILKLFRYKYRKPWNAADDDALALAHGVHGFTGARAAFPDRPVHAVRNRLKRLGIIPRRAFMKVSDVVKVSIIRPEGREIQDPVS